MDSVYEVLTFDSFAEAVEAAPDGFKIGGVFVGETPRYFLHPQDAPDVAVRELAFEATHGRPMNGPEKQLAELQDQVAPTSVRPVEGP